MSQNARSAPSPMVLTARADSTIYEGSDTAQWTLAVTETHASAEDAAPDIWECSLALSHRWLSNGVPDQEPDCLDVGGLAAADLRAFFAAADGLRAMLRARGVEV